MKLRTVESHFKEKLKDPHFKEAFRFYEQKLDIATKIVGYRIDHCLSQKQLADKLGITQQYVSKIETGEVEDFISLEKILTKLGYTIKFRVVAIGKKRKAA